MITNEVPKQMTPNLDILQRITKIEGYVLQDFNLPKATDDVVIHDTNF